jgi:hypothetical protein
MLGPNAELTALLRAESKKVWDGYSPSTALVTPSAHQGDEPVYDGPALDELQRRRDAYRLAADILGATAEADVAAPEPALRPSGAATA